jgi:hypothetical protein
MDETSDASKEMTREARARIEVRVSCESGAVKAGDIGGRPR